MSGIFLNVGSGHHNAPKPWVNIDLVEATDPDTKPDLRIHAGEPLPFQDGECDRVLLSHVVEHVAWRDVAGFLHDVHRVVSDDGLVCVAGPDVYKACLAWRRGDVDFDLVKSVMEHGTLADEAGDWPNARHQWSSSEERVTAALEECGFRWTTYDGGQAVRDGWPLVGWQATWQFCVKGKRA